MKTPFVVSGARALVLERFREPSFLIVLVINALLCFSFAVGDVTIKWGDYRGAASAAWIGTNAALVTLMVLSLCGFYLVKDALDRDTRTHVRALLEASPVTSVELLWSKTAGNLVYLLALALPPLILALALKLAYQAPGDVATLLAPFALLVLPVLAAVAATALLFEALPLLRGAAGNVVYFFVWCFLIAASNQRTPTRIDVLGLHVIKPLIRDAVTKQYHGATGFFDLTLHGKALRTFLWTGVDWNVGLIVGRLMWLLPFVLFPFIAALSFRRDRRAASTRPFAARFKGLRVIKDLTTRFTLRRFYPRSAFVALSLSEVSNALKSQTGWWLLGAGFIVVMLIVTPYETARQSYYLLAAIWPMAWLSGLGEREIRYRTATMLYATRSPILRNVSASALAGIASMVVMLSAIVLRAALHGEWLIVAAGSSSMIFVPALALALGTLSGRRPLFEIVYTMLWYFGPVRASGVLNFLGRSSAAPTKIILLASPLLFMVALAARRGQLLHGRLEG